jgi:hypothetical protein
MSTGCLRVGGLLWIDSYMCHTEEPPQMVVRLIGRFGYKKLKWAVGQDGLRLAGRGRGLPPCGRLPRGRVGPARGGYAAAAMVRLEEGFRNLLIRMALPLAAENLQALLLHLLSLTVPSFNSSFVGRSRPRAGWKEKFVNSR